MCTVFVVLFTLAVGGTTAGGELAAHCKDDQYRPFPSDYVVAVGSNFKDEKVRNDFHLEEFIVHEAYERRTRENDIALIELNVPLQYSRKIYPIVLGRRFVDGSIEAISAGYVADPEGHLRYLTMETITNTDCRAYATDMQAATFGYKGKIFDFGTLCAVSGIKDHGVHKDESGEPLVYNNTLIGITSTPSRGNHPALFTRVSEYVDWVHRKMDKKFSAFQ